MPRGRCLVKYANIGISTCKWHLIKTQLSFLRLSFQTQHHPMNPCKGVCVDQSLQKSERQCRQNWKANMDIWSDYSSLKSWPLTSERKIKGFFSQLLTYILKRVSEWKSPDGEDPGLCTLSILVNSWVLLKNTWAWGNQLIPLEQVRCRPAFCRGEAIAQNPVSSHED